MPAAPNKFQIPSSVSLTTLYTNALLRRCPVCGHIVADPNNCPYLHRKN